jgi:hypothetical protein
MAVWKQAAPLRGVRMIWCAAVPRDCVAQLFKPK